VTAGVRVAYLIVSHRNPEQVARLARTLRNGSSSAQVVIHHDRRVSRLDSADLAGAHVLPFFGPARWGDFGYTAMLLHALGWVEKNLSCDWLVLLSGQDYPLVPPARIEEFLGGVTHDALMGPGVEVAPPRGADVDDDYTLRYFYDHYRLPTPGSDLPAPGRRALARAVSGVRRVWPWVYVRRLPRGEGVRVGVRRGRAFGGLRCYRGLDWFTLSRRAVARINHEAPAVVPYFRRTIIASEALFHTILLNAPDIRIHPENFRFMLFGDTAAHPDVLRVGDLPRALASGCHFARKFDVTVDPEALDRLDEHLVA
jgi:hypothetical protein